MQNLKIIIVGADIGGPAAAIGLTLNDHNVTMFERSSEDGWYGLCILHHAKFG
jgi:2-polyprenyl-6-methoxyphenol hydroxylase-like FAD-dependent oxidoreductase